MSLIATHVEQVPALTRPEAASLAAAENTRFVELVTSLDAEDWVRPTDCPEWDVRALALHLLGAMEGHVSVREFVHQMRAGKKAAGDRPFIDGMTEVQVRDRRHLAPPEIVARLAVAGPRAAAARKRLPAPFRRLSFAEEVAGVTERWRVGYLFDVILTRDTWMHRVDLSRATGRPLELTPGHDGRIVADVVAEWARRHGRPFTLTLSGPAGGVFTQATAGEQIAMDAVEFARTLSGRAQGTGLLSRAVPF